MQKSDWIGIFAIGMMLFGTAVISYFIITDKINDCTSDPLKFTVEKLVDDLNYSYVELEIYENKGDLIPIKVKYIDLNPVSKPVKVPDFLVNTSS